LGCATRYVFGRPSLNVVDGVEVYVHLGIATALHVSYLAYCSQRYYWDLGKQESVSQNDSKFTCMTMRPRSVYRLKQALQPCTAFLTLGVVSRTFGYLISKIRLIFHKNEMNTTDPRETAVSASPADQPKRVALSNVWAFQY
jgi:hypothetical protein